MANDEISLETRASSAYVQGQLKGVIGHHQVHCKLLSRPCECMRRVAAITLGWKQAEAELKASKESK